MGQLPEGRSLVGQDRDGSGISSTKDALPKNTSQHDAHPSQSRNSVNCASSNARGGEVAEAAKIDSVPDGVEGGRDSTEEDSGCEYETSTTRECSGAPLMRGGLDGSPSPAWKMAPARASRMISHAATTATRAAQPAAG